MKKKAVLAAFTLCSVFIIGVAAAVSTQSGKTVADRESYNQPPSSKAQSETPYAYIMKLYNGKIVIFKIGEAEPFETLDTDIKDLPQGDIELLTSGIKLQNAAELQRAIEDYTS